MRKYRVPISAPTVSFAWVLSHIICLFTWGLHDVDVFAQGVCKNGDGKQMNCWCSCWLTIFSTSLMSWRLSGHIMAQTARCFWSSVVYILHTAHCIRTHCIVTLEWDTAWFCSWSDQQQNDNWLFCRLFVLQVLATACQVSGTSGEARWWRARMSDSLRMREASRVPSGTRWWGETHSSKVISRSNIVSWHINFLQLILCLDIFSVFLCGEQGEMLNNSLWKVLFECNFYYIF